MVVRLMPDMLPQPRQHRQVLSHLSHSSLLGLLLFVQIVDFLFTLRKKLFSIFLDFLMDVDKEEHLDHMHAVDPQPPIPYSLLKKVVDM